MGEVNNEYLDKLPGDLTPQEFRRHPLAELLAGAARGQMPSAPALEKLGVTGEALEKVEAAAESAIALKREGAQEQARKVARAAAAEAIDQLPDPREALNPADEPDPLADASPQELAEQIPRM